VNFEGQPDVKELSDLLKDESPRCAVIVAAAFFDQTLRKSLGETKDQKSFAQRVKAALEWGLLTQDEHDDLDVLRKMRNDFAHDLRVQDFDTTAEASVNALKIWTTASNARPLDRDIQTPLDRLLFVVGVIAFRLQRRKKSPSKVNALPEPELTDWGAWPPVFSK
jgi:hypothetical protein